MISVLKQAHIDLWERVRSDKSQKGLLDPLKAMGFEVNHAKALEVAAKIG